MATNMTVDGALPFRIKRPVITTSGFVSDVDATIKMHLAELNELLGAKILVHEQSQDLRAPEWDDVATETKTRPAQQYARDINVLPDVQHLLSNKLSPKFVPANPKGLAWAEDSLVHQFYLAKRKPDETKITLSDYIDLTAELSALKYAFKESLAANWTTLDFNSKSVLDDYPEITDYLIAFAFHVMKLQEVNGLKNFLLSNQLGVKNVANYAIISAARTIIDAKQLEVPEYNTDDSEIVKKIKAAGLSLSTASFKTSLQAQIDDFIFNSKESKLIDDAQADIGVVPAKIKPKLIKYIKHSPVPINAANAKFFLPLFISQIVGEADVADPTEVDVEESDKDFEVEFLTDDDALIQISRSAIKCAAQLYYGMTVGDELDVFNTVNYFTHKFLIRGGINIEDAHLREDLQTYVFSNRFTDLKTHKLVDRTRPGERQMFYRQVFNYGNAQITDDLIPNQEFSKLWKVLILESAKYLERAQASFHPDSYVSRQNVMQAVEDLQYNLSTHCTGMANVITPLIYAELNFVIQRFFMHREIIRQIVPAGGTWWRVVETLYMGMKHARPKATVLYNKAKLGHDIIRSIADYNPATFEDDRNFSAFISNVDAFITTQSILQEALTDDLKNAGEETHENGSRRYAPQSANESAASNGNAEHADAGAWDF